MSFVVVYENAPGYKGLDVYVAESSTDRVATTAVLADALMFDTEDLANAFAEFHPKLDKAHTPAQAREVKVVTEKRLV